MSLNTKRLQSAFLVGGLFASTLPSQSSAWPERAPLFQAQAVSLNRSVREFAEHHRQGHWSQCVLKLEKAMSDFTEIAPWIYLVGLECAENEKSISSKQILKILAFLPKHSNWLWGSSWSARLQSKWKDALARLTTMPRTDWSKAEANALWSLIELLPGMDASIVTAEDRALALKFAGEVALPIKGKEVAANLFERSLGQRAQPDLEKRLFELRQESVPQMRAESASTATSSDSGRSPLPSEGQANAIRLEAEFNSAVQQFDFPSAARIYVKMTKILPGASSTDRVQTLLQNQVAQALSDSGSSAAPLKAALMGQLTQLGMDRLLVWGRFLYNRGHFVESAGLLEKWWKFAEDEDYVRYQDPKLYELVIDAAVAVDHEDLVENVAGFLLERFPGSPAARTASFRSGLLNYRMGKWERAVSRLELVLSESNRDPFDLQSRYWLWHSLVKLKSSERSQLIRSTLIERYPFSYYGLRALMDRDGGRLVWRDPQAGHSQNAVSAERSAKDRMTKNTKANVGEAFLLPSEQRTLRRVQILMALEWHELAHLELTTVAVPMDSKGRSQFARLWAQVRNYVQASRLAHLAWDEDASHRNFELMREVWPLAYGSDVEKASIEFKLEKDLVQALTKQESGFNPRAISSSKAIGLMQMIPPTANEISTALKLGPLNLPRDLFQADRNIRMGTYYLAKMIQQFDRIVPLGVAAYNAGPTRLQRWMQSRKLDQSSMKSFSSSVDAEIWFDEIPYSETSQYVKSVLRNLLLYRLLAQPTQPNGEKVLDFKMGQPLWANPAN